MNSVPWDEWPRWLDEHHNDPEFVLAVERIRRTIQSFPAPERQERGKRGEAA